MGDLHLLRSPTGGSASRKAGARELLEFYRSAGHAVTDLTGPSAAESQANLAEAMATGAVERLVIAGGDGLVHLAVQVVAHSDVIVGLIPSGTGNDFATGLGIDRADPAAALGDGRPVDLMRVDCDSDGSTTWVASVAIAGFPAAINARANAMTFPAGSSRYTLAALLELPAFERAPIDLTVDGASVHSDSAMLAVGNTSHFGGGMLVCPDARPDDGLLHLTSIEGVGRLGILRHLAQKSGGSADRPEVRRTTARSISVTSPGLAIWGDGEPVTESPVTFTIAPAALTIAGMPAPSAPES